jgi:pimeloyl-ACP methyl ester carboxylesterase
MSRFLVLVCSLTGVMAATAAARADHSYHEAPLAGSGEHVRYALVVPYGYKADQTYPVLLALPPGGGSQERVEDGLRYWESEAQQRGWVVVSPLAPAGQDFYSGGEKAIIPLLDKVSQDVHVQGGRFYLAGISNGGRGAFHIAIMHPDRFSSLLVLPGAPPTDEDFNHLEQLRGLPITMYVSERDEAMLLRMRDTHAELGRLGIPSTLQSLPGQGQVIYNLPGPALFDVLDAARGVQPVAAAPSVQPAPPPPSLPDTTAADINRVVDDWHDAAAKADESRYFGHFAPEAIFLGTDATERWTLNEFRAYAHPYFQKGKAWSFTPHDRHVTLAAEGKTAWFDELLDTPNLGPARGSGVLIRSAIAGGPVDTWKITQYNLSIPIPNALAKQVVQIIRDDAAKPKGPKTGDEPR